MQLPFIKIWADAEAMLFSLTDEQLGAVVHALFMGIYHDTLPDFKIGTGEAVAYSMMYAQAIRDDARAEKIRQKRVAAGKASAEKRASIAEAEQNQQVLTCVEKGEHASKKENELEKENESESEIVVGVEEKKENGSASATAEAAPIDDEEFIPLSNEEIDKLDYDEFVKYNERALKASFKIGYEPSLNMVSVHVTANHLNVDPRKFYAYYSEHGWQGVKWRERLMLWDATEKNPTAHDDYLEKLRLEMDEQIDRGGLI